MWEIPRANARTTSYVFMVLFTWLCCVFNIMGNTKKAIHLHCQNILVRCKAGNHFLKPGNKYFTFRKPLLTLRYFKKTISGVQKGHARFFSNFIRQGHGCERFAKYMKSSFIDLYNRFSSDPQSWTGKLMNC